jgi:tetratricopeptide (TPR) repeat protein
VQRLPSSRTFVPTEIWAYDHVPGIGYSSRLQFLFFRPRDTGFFKLYSPQLHTIRALLLPQAGTRGMFPVNDAITPNDVLNRLNASPTELEVVEASLGVARGITGSGNSEILALATSPAAMLRRRPAEQTRARIRFATDRPKVSWNSYQTAAGEPALDLAIEANARQQIAVEIPGLELFETQLNLPEARPVSYSQRLFLLPGRYYAIVTVDGFPSHYQLEVKETASLPPAEASLTYRANLFAGAAQASLGRQHLRAGRRKEARDCFAESLRQSRNAEALTGMARLEALEGRLDEGRALLQEVLRQQPRHFEALVTLAAVTAEFQDWAQAAAYYRQARAVRPMPAVDQALAAVEARLR